MDDSEFGEYFLAHMREPGLSQLADIYIKDGSVKENSGADICFHGALNIVDAVEFVTRSAFEGKISFERAIRIMPGIMGDYLDYGTDELNEAIDEHDKRVESRQKRKAKSNLRSVLAVESKDQ